MEQRDTTGGRVTAVGEDPSSQAPGVTVIARMAGAETGGVWSLVECVLARYQIGPPLHRHTYTTELIYVLEGTLVVTLGPRTVTALPGSAAVVPPGMVHTCFNPTAASVRLLLFRSPCHSAYDRRTLAALAALAWERHAPDAPAQAILQHEYDQFAVDARDGREPAAPSAGAEA